MLAPSACELTMSRLIVSHALFYAKAPTPFVIKDAAKMSRLAGLPHRHDYYSILWCFEGAGLHRVDCVDYPLKPHSIFFLGPKQVHQIVGEANPAGRLILLIREFLQSTASGGGFLDRLGLFDTAAGAAPLLVASGSVRRLMAHTHGMLDAFQSNDPMRFEIIEAHLKLFLIECARQRAAQPPPAHPPAPGRETVADQFKRLVEQHYASWRQVGQYAERLHVSANYLGEVVRRQLHQPPKDYIQDRVVMEAKRQLLFTTRSIKEIGGELGFKDPSRFCRFFKDAAGLSAGAFRQSAARKR